MGNFTSRYTLCLTALLACAFPASAQQPEKWRFWTAADGMRESYTYSLSVDAAGRVWARHGAVPEMSLLDGYTVARLPEARDSLGLDWENNSRAYASAGGAAWGPKLRGTIVGNAGGDWVTMRKDGSFKLDVRLTLITDDGAPIYMTYFGIGVRRPDGAAIRTAPLFETGDVRYDWLNHVQAVGVGVPGDDSVQYDVYALTV